MQTKLRHKIIQTNLFCVGISFLQKLNKSATTNPNRIKKNVFSLKKEWKRNGHNVIVYSLNVQNPTLEIRICFMKTMYAVNDMIFNILNHATHPPTD